MVNNKLLFLFLLLLFCSGCSAEYNLDIDKNDKFQEVVEITEIT